MFNIRKLKNSDEYLQDQTNNYDQFVILESGNFVEIDKINDKMNDKNNDKNNEYIKEKTAKSYKLLYFLYGISISASMVSLIYYSLFL